MAKSLIEYLVQCDDGTLATVWADFNCRDWPDDVPAEYMPLWWNGEPATHLTPRDVAQRKIGYVDTPMEYAESRLTKAQLDAAWAKRRGRDQNIDLRQIGVPADVLEW